MKKIIAIAIVWVICIPIIIVASMFGVKYAVPYLIQKSEFDKNLPTITLLQDSLQKQTIVIDSLQSKLQLFETENVILTKQIEVLSKHSAHQKEIERQLKELNNKVYSSSK